MTCLLLQSEELVYSVVFHVNWKNNSALQLQLLLSYTFNAQFQKSLCLVSNEWEISSLLLLQTLSSFPNNFCVKQKMCLSSGDGRSICYALAMTGICREVLCAQKSGWTSLHLSNMPMKRQNNRRNPCPLCLCSPLRHAHVHNPTGAKPKEWTSKFLSWNVSCCMY